LRGVSGRCGGVEYFFGAVAVVVVVEVLTDTAGCTEVGQTVQFVVTVALVTGGVAGIAQDFEVAKTVVAQGLAGVNEGVAANIAVAVEAAADSGCAGDSG